MKPEIELKQLNKDEINEKSQLKSNSVFNKENNNEENVINNKENNLNIKINNISRAKKESNSQKCLIFFYCLLIILFTVWVYIIRPLCVFLEIFFLTSVVNVKPKEYSSEEAKAVSSILMLIGWLIILLLPIYNFITVGIRIIILQQFFLGKFFVGLFNLIEAIFNIPLTFLYETNLYSIFLYEEKGIKQLLNPWLIFFPTEYMLSVFELIRNTIEPAYFCYVGFTKLTEIRNNNYQQFSIMLNQLMIALCLIRLIGNVVMIIIRIVRKPARKMTGNVNNNENIRKEVQVEKLD